MLLKMKLDWSYATVSPPAIRVDFTRSLDSQKESSSPGSQFRNQLIMHDPIRNILSAEASVHVSVNGPSGQNRSNSTVSSHLFY